MGDTAVSMAVCSVSLSDVQNGQKWKVEEMIRPKIQSKKIYSREVVVAQSIEGLLPIPESVVQIQSSAKIYIFIEHLFTVNCVLKR